MDRKWVVWASRLFCIGCVVFLGGLAFRYLSPLIWVLGIGLGVAAVVNPLAKRTAARLRIPRKLCAVCYVILLLGLLGGILYYGVLRLWREICSLGAWLSENPDWMEEQIGRFSGWLGEIAEGLPFLEKGAGEGIRDWLNTILDVWKTRLGEWVGNLLRRTPEAILTVVVTLLTCFYISVDGERIRGELLGMLPTSAQESWKEISLRLRRGIRGYIRAYGILMALTFLEVWIGLTVLGQKYSFLMAAVIAAVDILPVLGAGTVLVPWAIFSFLFHESSLGIGLLILYGIITIIRQVVEPHLIGGSIGVHPLLVLLCAFGASLAFGIGGMLLGPLFAVVIRELVVARFRDTFR